MDKDVDLGESDDHIEHEDWADPIKDQVVRSVGYRVSGQSLIDHEEDDQEVDDKPDAEGPASRAESRLILDGFGVVAKSVVVEDW